MDSVRDFFAFTFFISKKWKMNNENVYNMFSDLKKSH